MTIIDQHLKDFRGMKENLANNNVWIENNITKILQAAGIKTFFSISKDEIRCACPLHKGDNDTSFVVYPQSRRYICWSNSCHEKFGNRLSDLVRALDNVDMVSIAKQTDAPNLQTAKPKYRVSAFDDKILKPFVQYQNDRGITETDKVFSYKVPNNEYTMNNRAVFLLWDYNKTKILGVTGRSLVDNRVKWKHIFGKNQSHLVYYPHSISYKPFNTCYITEGVIDSIKVELAISRPTIAILSNRLTYQKTEKLCKTFKNFVIIPDHDGESEINAGIEGAKKTQAMLKEFGRSAKIQLLTDITNKISLDPGDLSISDLKGILCHPQI